MIGGTSNLGHDGAQSRDGLHVGVNNHPNLTQKRSMIRQRWHEMLLCFSHEIRQHGDACVLAHERKLHLQRVGAQGNWPGASQGKQVSLLRRVLQTFIIGNEVPFFWAGSRQIVSTCVRAKGFLAKPANGEVAGRRTCQAYRYIRFPTVQGTEARLPITRIWIPGYCADIAASGLASLATA